MNNIGILFMGRFNRVRNKSCYKLIEFMEIYGKSVMVVFLFVAIFLNWCYEYRLVIVDLLILSGWDFDYEFIGISYCKIISQLNFQPKYGQLWNII
jgi:hypothetical protein